MKKNHSLLIIIFSTFVSVITMSAYNVYINNLKYFEENQLSKQGVVQYKKNYTPEKTTPNDSHLEVGKKEEEENFSANSYLEEAYASHKRVSDAYKSEDVKNSDNSNIKSSNVNMGEIDKKNEIYLRRREESLENNNFDNKENEQSVFKVAAWEIEDNLTATDKIKLLYISMQLGKEDYKKVEEYLYAKDAEDGVLKALKLLKEDLSKKEYEKVRKIAGKFIDMDAAESLY